MRLWQVLNSMTNSYQDVSPAALNHPNVCTMHEIHDEGEYPFIVMEYIDSRTIRDIITDVGAKHSGDDGGKGEKNPTGNASPLLAKLK